MRVWNADGNYCGRVFELRLSAGTPKIECLSCGRRGLLERLGWKQTTLHAIPWHRVAKIGRRGIHLR